MDERVVAQLGSRDVDAVQPLFHEVFTQPPWNDDWSDTTQLRRYLLDLLEPSGSLCFGLYKQGVLIGLSLGRVLHWYSGTEYHIQEFCIKQCEQAKGLGADFLVRMEALLLQQGIESILLSTNRTAPSYGFYCKQGFSEIADCIQLYKNIPKE
jgi:aminoglycoside 6'-N-acetyltransferase I